MKNKDTVLLENAYDQVVNKNVIKENEPNREPETRYLSASNGWDTLGDIIYGHLYDSGYEGDGVDQRDDSTVHVWDANPEKLKKLVEYLNANGYPVADYTLPRVDDEYQLGIIDFYDDYPQYDEEDEEDKPLQPYEGPGEVINVKSNKRIAVGAVDSLKEWVRKNVEDATSVIISTKDGYLTALNRDGWSWQRNSRKS